MAKGKDAKKNTNNQLPDFFVNLEKKEK